MCSHLPRLVKVARSTVGKPTRELGKMKYLVIYERTPNGYGAYLPDIPGCIAAGDTLEETRSLIRSACEMHLEAMREDGDPIPEPSTQSGYLELAG